VDYGPPGLRCPFRAIFWGSPRTPGVAWGWELHCPFGAKTVHLTILGVHPSFRRSLRLEAALPLRGEFTMASVSAASFDTVNSGSSDLRPEGPVQHSAQGNALGKKDNNTLRPERAAQFSSSPGSSNHRGLSHATFLNPTRIVRHRVRRSP
jgi:hypothetical protein